MKQKPHSKIEWVIVQAGGRGSRLRHHTWNKPKCLVSIDGKPILYHIFDKFPQSKFIVIGDYKLDLLKKYLNYNKPNVDVLLIKAEQQGTLSGMRDALKLITEKQNLLIVWSDLYLKNSKIPEAIRDKSAIYLTNELTCRWSVTAENEIIERPSTERGIPGIFYFSSKKALSEIPDSGEFVKWAQSNLRNPTFPVIENLMELGDFEKIELTNNQAGFSRFFNKVEIERDVVKKTVIDKKFLDVHANEVNWYKEIKKLKFRNIPDIVSLKPLIMRRIEGNHIFDIKDLSDREKTSFLSSCIEMLLELHNKSHSKTSTNELYDVYVNKTVNRVNSVKDLIPHFQKQSFTINGKKCKNIFADSASDFLKQSTSPLLE